MSEKTDNKTQDKNKEQIEENENQEIENKPSDIFYNNQAEVISRIILEKIISYTVTKVHNTKIFETIGDYCFNYIDKLMKPFLKSNYINYDIEHLKDKNDYIFYDKKKQLEENTWVEIPEPNTTAIDRCSHDQMRFSAFIPSNIDEGSSINLSNTQIQIDDKEKKDSTFLNEKKEEKKENIKKEEKKKKKLTKKEKEELEKKEKEEEEKNKKEKNENDGKDGPWIDLPSYDLPQEIYMNKYIINDNTPEINELRKEIEYEKVRKIKQKLIEDEEKRRNKLKEMNTKIIREFDSKRLTFDSNGNIINLKMRNNIENNLGNEFYWSRSIVKEGRSFRHLFIKPLRKSMSLHPPKLINANEELRNMKKNSIIKEEKENEEDNEEKDTDKNKKRNSSISWKKSANVILGEDIIRNPDLPDENYFIKLKKNKEKMYKDLSIPSGQNFEKIIPEVGVKITSDKKVQKEGGLNYSQKFKKPSMAEFSKLAFETENLNTRKFLTSNLSQTENLMESENSRNTINDKKENNYIGYSQEFNSLDNPLIQNAHKIIGSNITDSYPNSQSSSISNSYRNNSYKINSYKTKMLSDEIQLTGNMNTLSNVFNDNINIYKSFDYSGVMKSIRPTSLFSNRRNKIIDNLKNIKVTNEIMIDKFNSNIVKNKNWGANDGPLPTEKNDFIKPKKSNHIKELGFRIVSTKLPRDRKFVETPDPFLINRANWISLSQDKDKIKKKKN